VEKRTRLGKIVGSVKTNPEGWSYWQDGDRWLLVAPSGARTKSFETEDEARRERDGLNAEWFAPLH
jgi:hypothetical protein